MYGFGRGSDNVSPKYNCVEIVLKCKCFLKPGSNRTIITIYPQTNLG